MASAVANLGNMAKVAKMSNAVQNVVPKSDPEDPQAEEESDALITWQDYRENPGLFAPILFFTSAGFIGLILLAYCAFTDEASIIVAIGGLIMFVVGFWAAWEVRSLGSLHDQIERLKMIRKELQSQTMELQGQVGGMEQENKELEENVEAFRNQNNALDQNVSTFDNANDDLRDTLSNLEGANSQLKGDVQDLNAKNTELEAILVKMNEQKERIEQDLENFDELRHKMESMASETGEQMHDMISKTMFKFEGMDKLVRENERVLLRQIAADVEMVDNNEGTSRKEFKRFLARLPKRYRVIVQEQSINFDALDKDSDESLDPRELTALIDRLILEKEKRDASAKATKAAEKVSVNAQNESDI